MAKLNIIIHYSSLKCHMILQKLFCLYAAQIIISFENVFYFFYVWGKQDIFFFL